MHRKCCSKNLKRRAHTGNIVIVVTLKLRWTPKGIGCEDVGWIHLAKEEEEDHRWALVNMIMSLEFS
jgi:hypothetical protein